MLLLVYYICNIVFFFSKQKTAYEMRISDWSSDVCSSDLWVTYPLYRSKNKQINTMEARIKGCFTYSMNAQDSPAGKAPPLGDQIYTDLQTYFHWLAKGAPTDTKLKGAGFIKLKETKQIGRAHV